MASRLGIKTVDSISAVVVPSPRSFNARPEGALSSSPHVTDSSLMNRMRAVLKRHQCGYEEEAVTVCMRQAAQGAPKPSALAAGSPCSGYINSLRYCQLQTQQHNYPVAPAFLY